MGNLPIIERCLLYRPMQLIGEIVSAATINN